MAARPTGWPDFRYTCAYSNTSFEMHSMPAAPDDILDYTTSCALPTPWAQFTLHAFVERSGRVRTARREQRGEPNDRYRRGDHPERARSAAHSTFPARSAPSISSVSHS